MTKPAKFLMLMSLVAAAQIAASAATQTIAFDAIPNQIFGTSPFPIVAQASSGLPVTFTSTTPAICKTAGSLVMLLSAGPCFITASQAGNGSYDAATSVTQSFTVSQGNPAASFGFYNPTTVTTRPYAITVGDFNNDGIPDMATVSLGASGAQVGAVSVLIGDGHGAFTATAGSPISVGQFPVSITTGDFNADGNADLAIANSNDGTVTVLLGNGAGAFSPATGSPFATDAGPWSIVVGDFNGDGIEDLATANQAGNDVTILLGNGLGGFAPVAGTPPKVDTAPLSMVVADFNGDGFQDLAVGNGFTISVLLGNGSGGFAAATGSPFSLEAQALAVGDFNGDGIPDLAAAHPFQSTVSVYIGNGAGGFAPASGSPFSVGSFSPGIATTSVAVGDFNGDGFADIAVGLYSGNVVTVLAGNGSGGFTAGGTFGVFFFEQEPIALATGDFNRDGIEDLAVAYQQNGLAAVWLGAVAGTTSVLSTTSPLTIDAGQSVPLSLAVSHGSVDFSPFTGTITFLDGTTVLGAPNQTASPYTFTAADLSVGTHTLTATYSGDARSAASTSNSITIQVVVPVSQSIAFSALPDTPFIPSAIALTATASSNLPVSYASTTPDVCTVSGSNITLTGLGSCSITASQPGNVYYTAAPSVTQSFNVTQGSQTISFDAISSQIFGVSPFPVVAYASSGLPMTIASTTPSVCKTAGSLVTLAGPGTCSITASQNGNVNYSGATPVTRSFAVSMGKLSALAQPSGGLSLVPGNPPAVGQFAAVGDFNGDGIPDLVRALGTAYLGNGSGSFVFVNGSNSSTDGIAAVGDFNGDGIEDLASVDLYGHNINILLGNGAGRFTVTSGSPVAPAVNVSALAVGDFNGDGKQDLAVVYFDSARISILLGNGAGGFTVPTGSPFALGSVEIDPVAIAVGDFNGDGIADIATANKNGGTVSVLLGDGTGRFAPATGSPFPAGAGADGIVIGDFNGDGVQDIATADNGGGVTILLGAASGGFSAPAQFSAGTAPTSLTMADLNGDGIEDLAVAAGNQVVVLLGDGTGAFTASVGPPLSVTGATAVLAADFNGDGIEDLAAAGISGSYIFLGGPAPTNSVLGTTSPAVIDVGQAVALGDVVSDTGSAYNLPTGTVTIMDGTTTLGTASQTASPYMFTATGLSAGNHTLTATYSGDSRSQTSASNSIAIQVVAPQSQSITFNALPDIPFSNAPISLTVTATSGLAVTLTSNTLPVCTVSGSNITLVSLGSCSITASQAGNVYFSAAANVTQAFNVNQGPQTIAFDTIQNQLFGVPPFVAAVSASSGLAVSVVSITPSVCTTASILVTLLKPGTCSVTASQSGNVDYSAATAVTRTFTVSKSTLGISYMPGPNSPVTVYNPDVIAIGDFNNDGIPDVAMAIEGGFSQIAVFLGDGKGGFAQAPGSPVSVGEVPYALAVGDFNGDGFQDIAVANNEDDNVTVLLGDGSGRFTHAAGSPIALVGRPLAMAVGDFNGDGIQDLVVSNSVSSNLTVLLGNGAGGFTLAAGGPISTAPYSAASMAVGDFNGDGIQDLAAADYSSGTISIMLGNGSGGFTVTTGPVLSTGAILTSLAVGDFNRDGIQDLAVVNNASNSVTVLLGNGLGAFSPAGGGTYTAGSGAWSVVATDLNGDGIVDLAVSNRTDNTVTLLLGDGRGGFAPSFAGPLSTGNSPVFLAAADLNGDGIEDIITSNFSSSNLTVLLGQPIGTTPQTITFAPLPNVPVATAPFTLTATSDSALTVFFTSNTPTVCTVSGATLTILIAGNCSITATQPGSTVYAAATPVTQNFTVLFGDVAPADNDYAAINALSQHGITNGCGSNDFCPNENVTRDQMAIFIVRAIYGNDNFTYTTTPYFTDVTSATFGFKWIQKLKDLGITGGCTATTYCPGEVVTRDQMAIFIIRARLGLTLAGPSPTFTYPATPYFTDATSTNEFAFPWIQRMKLDSITSGCTATTYCSSSPVTRGEMAIFIMRGVFNQFLPAGTPVITQISPSTIASGTSGTYTITGVNTNFVQGTTQLSPIPGVTIGTITVTSATTMTVQLTDAGGVPTQPYSLLVSTGSEQAVLPNGLVLQ